MGSMAGKGPLSIDTLRFRFTHNGMPATHASDPHELLLLFDTIGRHVQRVCNLSLTHEALKINLYKYNEFPWFRLEPNPTNPRVHLVVRKLLDAISLCEADTGWDPLGLKDVDPETGESKSVALCRIETGDLNLFSVALCNELKDALDLGQVEIVRSGLVADEEYPKQLSRP